MRYINQLKDGDNVIGIYLCKAKNMAQTKNGKDYENVTLTDKTGTLSCKIWEPNSMGIGDFDVNDYVEVRGRITLFNGALQMSIDRAFKASEGSYDPADYLPVSSRDINEMYEELKTYINSLQSPYYKLLLEKIFIEDAEFVEVFKKHSAAKSIHHGFVGGLMQHTLAVCDLCNFYCTKYSALNRDLLISAALCHDIGKVRELSDFPLNDYTDEGQLLGHIVMGVEIVDEKLREVKGFPKVKADQLKHCILAHHGEFEFGSPKKPALIEAVALNFADNTDAKIEAMTELFESSPLVDGGWLGYSRLFDSNIRQTR
ncbi:MAG: HD domain-containing protein [Lachnospiraceae bacterium]|nr:HD domain-containing protein [Lachnospiraceae bacterium]